MTEHHSVLPDGNSRTKSVSIQERAVHVGGFVVINGYRVNRSLLKQRFAEGGYQAQETAHFLLLMRVQAPSTLVVHWFAPEESRATIWQSLVRELVPAGIITCAEHLDALEAGIRGGMQCSGEVCRAWNALVEHPAAPAGLSQICPRAPR